MSCQESSDATSDTPSADSAAAPVTPPPTPSLESTEASSSAPVDSIDPELFTAIGADQGFDFVHDYQAQGHFYYPEIISGGGGFFDKDGDGDLDVFCVNGSAFPPQSDGPSHRLYENDGRGQFRDVSESAGVAIAHAGMGCVAADIDNDGDQDLFVSGVDRNLLFLNDGAGQFTERGRQSGVDTGAWATAATFFDYDLDGNLDLFVSHYVEWSPEIEHQLTAAKACDYEDLGARDYCGVFQYGKAKVSLLRGRGDGTFEDVSAAVGFTGNHSKALGVAVFDFDQDGWLDLFVANDTEPSQLFHNEQGQRFVDVGYELGLALDPHGNSYAGMGVDVSYGAAGDPLTIAVGNFSGEPVTMHRQSTNVLGEFFEDSRLVGVAGSTLRNVTFGVLFEDLNLDGWEELLVVNGHVGRFQEDEGIPFRQPTQLFQRRNDKFVEIALAESSPLSEPMVGRGCAAGDLDADGDLDVLILDNQGPARLLRNEQGGNHWLRVRLRGQQSNRDGIGALVRVTTGEHRQTDRLLTGNSYLSMNPLTLTFGLGASAIVDELEVRWPSGTRDVVTQVSVDQELLVTEGETHTDPVPWPGQGAAIKPFSQQTLEELLATVSANADNPQLHKLIGAKALESGQLELAQEHLKIAQALAPSDHVIAIHWARSLLHQGQLEAANQEVAGWPDRFEIDVISYNGLYYVGSLGESQLGLMILETCIQAQPEARLYYLRSSIEQEQGKLAEAVKSMELAIAQDASYGKAYLPLARLYAQQQDFAKAEATARLAQTYRPDSALPMRVLARALLAQDRQREAIQEFSKALKKTPEHTKLRWEFVDFLRLAGKLREAEAQLRTLLEQDPQPATWAALLEFHLDEKQPTKAMAAAQQALQQDVQDVSVLLLIARIQGVVEGEPQKALQTLIRTTTQHPEEVDAWRGRAQIEMQLDQRAALQSWQEVLRLSPGDPQALRMIQQLQGNG